MSFYISSTRGLEFGRATYLYFRTSNQPSPILSVRGLKFYNSSRYKQEDQVLHDVIRVMPHHAKVNEKYSSSFNLQLFDHHKQTLFF